MRGENNKIAGFWVRALSLVIDLIVMGLVCAILGFLYPPGLISKLGQTCIVFAIQVVYFVGMIYVFGATIGKISTGCLVINNIGQRPTLSRAFVREGVRIVPLLIANIIYYIYESGALMTVGLLYSILIMFSIVFSKKKRGLHDKLANTTVIKKKLSGLIESLFPQFNKQAAEKFALGGGVALIAMQILGKGFTSSRLFNGLIGLLCGALGAILGTFCYYFKLRLRENK